MEESCNTILTWRHVSFVLPQALAGPRASRNSAALAALLCPHVAALAAAEAAGTLGAAHLAAGGAAVDTHLRERVLPAVRGLLGAYARLGHLPADLPLERALVCFLKGTALFCALLHCGPPYLCQPALPLPRTGRAALLEAAIQAGVPQETAIMLACAHSLECVTLRHCNYAAYVRSCAGRHAMAQA